MENDPYEILGIGRDATAEEINSAYKKKAKKMHPDQGGSSEEFSRIKQASMVLLDPKKRKSFDEDGIIDENKPDNSFNIAMERIASFFINSTNATLKDNVDISQFDFVKGADLHFTQQITGAKNNIRLIEKQLKQFDRVLKRIKSKTEKNLISPMIESHMSSLKTVIVSNEQEINLLNKAKEILKDYSFEPEKAPSQILISGSTLWRF